jgi:hypothetical protein
MTTCPHLHLNDRDRGTGGSPAGTTDSCAALLAWALGMEPEVFDFKRPPSAAVADLWAGGTQLPRTTDGSTCAAWTTVISVALKNAITPLGAASTLRSKTFFAQDWAGLLEQVATRIAADPLSAPFLPDLRELSTDGTMDTAWRGMLILVILAVTLGRADTPLVTGGFPRFTLPDSPTLQGSAVKEMKDLLAAAVVASWRTIAPATDQPPPQPVQLQPEQQLTLDAQKISDSAAAVKQAEADSADAIKRTEAEAKAAIAAAQQKAAAEIAVIEQQAAETRIYGTTPTSPSQRQAAAHQNLMLARYQALAAEDLHGSGLRLDGSMTETRIRALLHSNAALTDLGGVAVKITHSFTNCLPNRQHLMDGVTRNPVWTPADDQMNNLKHHMEQLSWLEPAVNPLSFAKELIKALEGQPLHDSAVLFTAYIESAVQRSKDSRTFAKEVSAATKGTANPESVEELLEILSGSKRKRDNGVKAQGKDDKDPNAESKRNKFSTESNATYKKIVQELKAAYTSTHPGADSNTSYKAVQAWNRARGLCPLCDTAMPSGKGNTCKTFPACKPGDSASAAAVAAVKAIV